MNKVDFWIHGLLVVFTCCSSTTWGQSHPYEVQFSYEIENKVAKETLRSSRAGLLYSLIGEYYTSNTYSDIPVSWGMDTVSVSEYMIQEALEPIIEEAKEHRIVIISENHLKPQHRVFAKQLIVALKKQGFSHLGLETLTNGSNGNDMVDTELMTRGYPLDSPMTGTYTLEPKMADLVRKAIHHGYTLFPYERAEKIKGKDRDEIQADNVIQYLNAHPNEKVILLCGFHHAIESNIKKRGKYSWLAKYIKDKTGIDPLTIYQDNFTEKFIYNEHPILRTKNIQKPSVFTTNKNEIARLSNHVDIEVIHPKTWYITGRPHWLYEDDSFQAVEIKLDSKTQEYPVIVSAYLIGEVNSVPLDRVELKYKYDKIPLVLPQGKFIIEIYDGEHKTTYNEIVK